MPVGKFPYRHIPAIPDANPGFIIYNKILKLQSMISFQH